MIKLSFTWPPIQGNMVLHDQPTWARSKMAELPPQTSGSGRKAPRSEWVKNSPLGEGHSEQNRFHLRWRT